MNTDPDDNTATAFDNKKKLPHQLKDPFDAYQADENGVLIVNDEIRRLYDDNKLREIVKRAEKQEIHTIDSMQFNDKGAQAVNSMSDYPFVTFRVSNADEEARLIDGAVKNCCAVIVQSDTDSITFMALPRLEMTASGSDEYKLECEEGANILRRFAKEYFDVFNEAFHKLVKDKKLYESTIRCSSGILTVPFVCDGTAPGAELQRCLQIVLSGASDCLFYSFNKPLPVKAFCVAPQTA